MVVMQMVVEYFDVVVDDDVEKLLVKIRMFRTGSNSCSVKYEEEEEERAMMSDKSRVIALNSANAFLEAFVSMVSFLLVAFVRRR